MTKKKKKPFLGWVEEKALEIWENYGYQDMVNFLESLGFKQNDIELMLEHWQEGKVLVA